MEINSEYEDAWSFAEFQKTIAEKDINELRALGGTENFEESFYLNAIDRFVRTGKYFDNSSGDPIYDYMCSLMKDPLLQAQVLTDEVQAIIFRDNMLRFVDACLNRKRFHFNRKRSEMKQMGETLDWSLRKKEDGCDAIINTLGESYEEFGFRSALFKKQFEDKDNLSDEEKWKSMYEEYLKALNQYLRQQQNKYINDEKEHVKKKLDNQMSSIPDFLKKNNVSTDDFVQAWGMMGGEWNEYDFKRFLKLIGIQREYSQITELANRMGRTLNPQGDKIMYVGSGSSRSISHSTKSDIQGVTVGRSLDSLLPTELVQMADEDFNELFLVKYTTSKLQCFLHKSEQINPSKRLERKRARTKGPMIACIDTSGSMSGLPENIARSLVMKLVGISEQQSRPLYVIAFSVSANPIDVRKDRKKLLDFFANTSTGDTNAKKMIQHTLQLLETDKTYMCGDVVIIGDFRMDLVSNDLLDRIQRHRQCGTFFYGLQIGAAQDNVWTGYLDKTYYIEFSRYRN